MDRITEIINFNNIATIFYFHLSNALQRLVVVAGFELSTFSTIWLKSFMSAILADISLLFCDMFYKTFLNFTNCR